MVHHVVLRELANIKKFVYQAERVRSRSVHCRRHQGLVCSHFWRGLFEDKNYPRSLATSPSELAAHENHAVLRKGSNRRQGWQGHEFPPALSTISSHESTASSRLTLSLTEIKFLIIFATTQAWISFMTAFFSWYSIPPIMTRIAKDLKISPTHVYDSNVVAVSSTIG
jgi:hypothetical protein